MKKSEYSLLSAFFALIFLSLPAFSDDLTDCLSIFSVSRNGTKVIYTVTRPVLIHGKLPYFRGVVCPSRGGITVYTPVDFNTARNCYVEVSLENFHRDSDGDGIGDGYEKVCSSVVVDPENPVGLLEPMLADTDFDGLNDGEELKLGTCPALKDTDGDGLTDGQEHDGWYSIYDDGSNRIKISPTDPTKSDTDGDGLIDGLEAKIAFEIIWWGNYDEEIKTLAAKMPSVSDVDGDGLKDGEEVFKLCGPENSVWKDLTGSDATRDYIERKGMRPNYVIINWIEGGAGCSLYITAFYQDSDGDGLTDYDEARYGTSILGPDTDGDYLPDGKEVELSTDPRNPDTDGDGLLDGQEVLTYEDLEYRKPLVWINSNKAYEPSKSWTTDPTKADTDGDGLTDGQEIFGRPVSVYYNTLKYWHHYTFELYPSVAVFTEMATSDPTNPDTDGDGIDDSKDPFVWSFKDLDDDGLSDTQDPCPAAYDCDFDGLNDSAELRYGTDPKNPDTDCDYLPDGYEITVNYRDPTSGKTFYLDPRNLDTDGDGLIDGREIFCNCVDNDYCPPPFLPEKKKDCGVKKIEINVKGMGKIPLFCLESSPAKVQEAPRDSYEIDLKSLTKGVKVTKGMIIGKSVGSFDLDFSRSFYAVWIGEKKYQCVIKSVEARLKPTYGKGTVSVDVPAKILHINFTGDALIGTLYLNLEYVCNITGISVKDIRESFSLIIESATKPQIKIINSGWDEELNVGKVTMLCKGCKRIEIVAAGATINGKRKRVIEFPREMRLKEVKFRVVPIARFYAGVGDVGNIYGSFENKVEVLKTGKDIGLLLAKASLAKSTFSKIAYGVVAAAKGIKVVVGGLEAFVPQESEEAAESTSEVAESAKSSAGIKSKIKDMLIDKGIELLEEGLVKAADRYEEKISRVERTFKVVIKACNSEGCTVKTLNLRGYTYE